MIPETASNSAMVLSELCGRDVLMNSEQLSYAGSAARQLFRFALENDNWWLLQRAVECVAKTYGNEPVESGRLIRLLLDKERMKSRAFEEMFWLSREIKKFILLDPQLTMDIYQAAFSFTETSSETTSVTNSGAGILSLVSNRQQDYDTIKYSLKEDFEIFLNESPKFATRTLGFVINNSSFRFGGEFKPDKELTFEFLGNPVTMWPDYSGSYDQDDSGPTEAHIEMLGICQGKIEQLSRENESECTKIITLLTKSGRKAIIWKRLLESGARAPSSLGVVISQLLHTPEILSCSDTNEAAFLLLRSAFHLLELTEKEKIEQALIDLPSIEYFVSKEHAHRVQGRFVRGLQYDAIVTNEAKELRDKIDLQIKNQTSKTYIEPEFEFEEDWRRTSLQRKNIDPDQDDIKAIHDAENPVAAFNSKHLNSSPDATESRAMLSHLFNLRKTILSALENDVPKSVINDGWEVLHVACVNLAYVVNEFADADLTAFVHDTLMQAAKMQTPELDPERELNATEYPSFMFTGARCHAAEGLLALSDTIHVASRIQAIVNLSKDNVSNVRAVVGRHVFRLEETDVKAMWRIIEDLAATEQHPTVLMCLVSDTFGNFSRIDAPRVSTLCRLVWQRKTNTGHEKSCHSLKQRCTRRLKYLYLYSSAEAAAKSINEIVSDPVNYLIEAIDFAGQIRSEYIYGDEGNVQREEVRRKTFLAIETLLTSSIGEVKKLLADFETTLTEGIPDKKAELYRELVRIQDGIAANIFYASGAYALQAKTSNTEPPPSESIRARFWHEASASFSLMTELSHPHAIYQYIKTLESFVNHDPKTVLLRISKSVFSGKRANFQRDSLAVNQIVAIVNIYLGAHATLCREDAQVRKALIEILETFAAAKWPAANRLLYRMNDIYK